MVALVAVNDSTGQTDAAFPNLVAQKWLQNGYLEVAQAYEPYMLVGIANEWNGTNADFYQAHAQAIQTLRNGGIRNTLVVTANAWGQGCQSLLNDANALLQADLDGNTIFDIHIYTYLDYANCRNTTGVCGSAEIVAGCLNDLAAANIPLVVGEFGESHSSGDVAWQTTIERANANSQGYVPWLWFGDTEYRVLDLNQTWEGPLSSWGNAVVPGLNGQQASIFQ